MAQKNSNGLDSGFIGLAQEQIEGVEMRLAQIDEEIADLQDERATLSEQRTHLHGIVNPSAKTNGARVGEANAQSTRDAVVDLIRESGAPMHYRKDIYPRLVQAGHEIGGKDPANTLLSRIIDDGRLCRIAPGAYTLAEWEEHQFKAERVVQAAEVILRKAGSPLDYEYLVERVLGVLYRRIHLGYEDWENNAYLVGCELENQTAFLHLHLDDRHMPGDRHMIGLVGRDEGWEDLAEGRDEPDA